jgi:hypothetical protein
MGYALVDISRVSDEELRARSLGLIPTLAVWALRDARYPGRIAQSAVVVAAALVELVTSRGGPEALATIFRYISCTADGLDPVSLRKAIHDAAPQTEEVIMTLAEQWIAEGEAKGQQGLLLKQLKLKFGQLPETARLRIEQGSPADLDRWGERVLTAGSLSEVLEG